MLPLYEAKMIHHYDHRWATYEPDGSTRDVTIEEKRDPNFVVQPRYWVREEVVAQALAGVSDAGEWLLGIRDVARNTDERTVISARFPRAAVGNNLPVIVGAADERRLAANLSSFAMDFLGRPKVGGTHVNFFIANQLPVLPPTAYEERSPWSAGTIGEWVDERVDFLTAAWGYESAREAARADLDAGFFHLYDISRDDVDYIMDTFPIVKRKDEAAHGDYRTKRLILAAYDALAEH